MLGGIDSTEHIICFLAWGLGNAILGSDLVKNGGMVARIGPERAFFWFFFVFLLNWWQKSEKWAYI